MSNESLHAAKDPIWKQYQFVFQNADTVDEQLLASIREMIASLNLQKEPLDIRYQEVENNPLKVDVYIEENVDRYYVTGLLKPREEHIFPLSDRPVKEQAFTSARTSAATDTAFMPESVGVLDGTVLSEDNIQVQAITFKGAVRNPPPPAEPL